jgi:hypothetical protein
MARKLVLNPIYVDDTTSSTSSLSNDMSADITTVATAVQFQDNISYQINVTTSDSTGTFTMQGSNDNSSWANLGTMGVAAAANDVILSDFNQFPFAYVRVKYTSTVAGTGTCTIQLMARTVGA